MSTTKQTEYGSTVISNHPISHNCLGTGSLIDPPIRQSINQNFPPCWLHLFVSTLLLHMFCFRLFCAGVVPVIHAFVGARQQRGCVAATSKQGSRSLWRVGAFSRHHGCVCGVGLQRRREGSTAACPNPKYSPLGAGTQRCFGEGFRRGLQQRCLLIERPFASCCRVAENGWWDASSWPLAARGLLNP